MSYDVVTLGTATKDYFLQLAERMKVSSLQHQDFVCFPLGAKVEVEKVFMQTGGGATNTAVSFSRLGLKTGIISKVGDDEAGHAVLDVLKKNKADTKHLILDHEESTALGIVLTHSNGERTILVHRGASAKMHTREVSFGKLKTKWVYVCSLAGDSIALFYRALYLNARIALNPGKQELKILRKNMRLLKRVDVLILNKEEAEMLVRGSLQEMAKKLHEAGAGIVLVTDSRNGGAVYVHGVSYLYNVLPGKPVNTLGAGDAFGSTFVAGLIYGKSVEDALQFASVNTTNVVMHVGAKVGLLNLKEIPKFEKKYGRITIVKKYD